MSSTPQETLAALSPPGADPLLHCLALASHLLGLPVHVSALRVGFAVAGWGGAGSSGSPRARSSARPEAAHNRCSCGNDRPPP